jgi:hypothetical protein
VLSYAGQPVSPDDEHLASEQGLYNQLFQPGTVAVRAVRPASHGPLDSVDDALASQGWWCC